MKKAYLLILAISVLLWFSLACSNNYPTNSNYGMSGPVTISAVVSYGNYYFSPPSVTISHGQTVVWNLATIHTLNIDNGSGSCLVSGANSFPYSYIFSTAGTYNFHCGIHSSCGNGNCPGPTTCTGMTGTVKVN